MSLSFRSKFEERVWGLIPTGLRKKVTYEPKDGKLPYSLDFTYLPDIVIDNGVVVEIKGRLTSADRRKMLAVKKAHPNTDIRFVFMRPNNPLYKGSKTTYAAWAESHGFPWAHGAIPEDWITNG